MTGKYLITASEWFYAPDGKQYRAVWGDVKVIPTKDILGVDPNPVTANWSLQVGDENHHIIIGGCQINYSVKCEGRPNTYEIEQVFDGKAQKCEPAIYIPGDSNRIKNSKVTISGFGSEDKFIEEFISLIDRLDFKPGFRDDLLKEHIKEGKFKSFELIDNKKLRAEFKDPDKYDLSIILCKLR